MDIINKCYRCGGEPRLKTIHSYFYRVECSCGVIQNNLFQIQNLAIIDWNRFQQHYIAKMKPLGNDNGNNQANQKEVTPQKLTDAATEDELRKKLVALPDDALITVCDARRLCKASTDTIYLAVRKNIIPFQLSNDDKKIRLIKKGDAIAWRRANPPLVEEVRASIKDILGDEIETHPSRSASKEDYRKLVLALPDEMMISVFEASRLCKAATCTICRAIKKGILPAVQRTAGRIMYMVKKADAIEWRRNNPPTEKEDKDAIKDILG